MRYFTLIVIISLTVASMAVLARDVTMDRILSDQRITVITTEKPEFVSGYLLSLGIRRPTMMTITELMIQARNFKDGDSVLFVIDRKKARRMIAEEEKYLPCSNVAIAPNEVILFAAKAQDRNGWEMQISAPNEKWLKWELDRLGKSNLSKLTLQARGTILERFKVKQLYIISNEGRHAIDNWIKAQSQPGQDAIDWELCSPEDWDGSDSTNDILFMLNSETLSSKTRKNLETALPKAVSEWLSSPDHNSEFCAACQSVSADGGESHTVSAIVAPSSRQMGNALGKYNKLEKIPSSLERNKLTDLRNYGRIIVIARFADRSRLADPKTLDDLAGSLTNAISSGTGFTCINRQDLKELTLETYLNQLPDKSSSDIQSKFGDATAVAVVDLSTVTCGTTYMASNPQCLTSPLPEFSESKPGEPHKPNPNDKPLFSGHTYDIVNGSRANDPHYIKDLEEYHSEKMPRYHRELRDWEQKKREYEERRKYHDMEWETAINQSQKVSITGDLRIYDLSSGDVDKVGKVVFTCPLKGSEQNNSEYRKDRCVVRGEDSRPSASSVPDSINDISDRGLVTSAIRQACEEAASRLLVTSLLPVDRVQSSASITKEQ